MVLLISSCCRQTFGEWLDPGHLAFFVVDAVDQFDLSGFEGKYRPDGRGGAAYAPKVMVRLLLFAYCEVRSSRQIERRCVRDVAYRVLAGNRCPDHATIARFRDQHQWRCGRCLCRCCGCARRPAWCGSGCWRWTAPSCRRMPPRSKIMT